MDREWQLKRRLERRLAGHKRMSCKYDPSGGISNGHS